MKYYDKFSELYKNIKKTEDENFVVVNCYKDENCSIENYVRIVFDKKWQKVYYTGDMGAYIFGQNIRNPLEFFKMNVNLPYWDEKLEAYEKPIKEENVDLEEVEKSFRELLFEQDNVCENMLDEEKEYFEQDLNELFKFYINDSFHYRVYDKLEKFCEEQNLSIETEDIYSCVEQCRSYENRYLWCVELLHYVSVNYL